LDLVAGAQEEVRRQKSKVRTGSQNNSRIAAEQTANFL